MEQMSEGPFKAPKKGKRLWWLKLPKDFFTTNSVIKKMRRMPGGDTYVVVTLKILLLALDHQDFRIYYEGVEDTFVKDIALTLDETEESVAGALKVLISQGWIVQEDEETLYSAKTEEMAGSESDSAERKRLQRQRDREREALLTCDNVTPMSQECHAREEKRREEQNRDRGDARGGRGEKTLRFMRLSELPSLYPEAFTAVGVILPDPVIDEVRAYQERNGLTEISADAFYGAFNSIGWSIDGAEITNWQVLYVLMESDARSGVSFMLPGSTENEEEEEENGNSI